MHLIYFTHNVLDAHGLSTLFTVGVFVGSGYGCLRLVIDALRLFDRDDQAPQG